MSRVWYVAYGTNLSSARFRCYLVGGRPDGGARTYPGCRDRAEPAGDASVDIPGAITFAGRSGVWGGGMATYDPTEPGHVAARAYLLTVGQFADVLAQETRRPPGGHLDLAPLHRTGRLRLGPGRYRTLVRVGTRAGVPMVSFAGRDHPHRPAPPTAPYLRTMALGLRESRGWPPARVGSYLASIEGAAPAWTPDGIADLVDRPLRRGR